MIGPGGDGDLPPRPGDAKDHGKGESSLRRARGNRRRRRGVVTRVSVFWPWVVLAAVVATSVVVVECGRRLLAGRLSARWPGAANAARRCAAPAFAFAAVVSANAAMPYALL